MAAALTYYAVLSMFPALLVMVSLVGLLADPETVTKFLTDVIGALGPASAVDTFKGPIESITANKGAAGVLAIVGVASALWSASGYVGAFTEASNTIYEVEEGRPFWKLKPLQLLVTFVCISLVALTALALVVSGPLATAVGEALGLTDIAVTAWQYGKWPVMLLLVLLILHVLYYASPNAGRQEVGLPGRAAHARRLDRRLGRLRVLRRALRLVQQDLRHDGRRRGVPAVAVAHEHLRAARGGVQRRDRAHEGDEAGRAGRRARAQARGARTRRRRSSGRPPPDPLVRWAGCPRPWRT